MVGGLYRAGILERVDPVERMNGPAPADREEAFYQNVGPCCSTGEVQKQDDKMRIFVIILSLFFSIAFVSCSSGSFASLERVRLQLGSQNYPTEKAYPHDDAVVLSELHNVTITVGNSGYLVTDEGVTRIVKLFKDVSDYSSVEFTIHRGERLESVSARTIRPDGSVIDLSPDDFHTISGDDEGGAFNSESKRVKFTFKGAEKNCIVEYDYRLRSIYVFAQDLWEIQSNIPILENTYRLTVPVMLVMPASVGGYGWNWHWKAFNCTLGKPKVNSKPHIDMLHLQTGKIDGYVTLEWTKRNIPAFRPEPMMPPHSDYIQYARFASSAWTTWNSLSEWYYGNYFKPQYVITDAVRRKARSITKDCPTEMDKLNAVYSFVQSLRYVAVERDQGVYGLAKPQQVLERGYGDCKDKAMLLVSLLRSVGIDAKPALIRTADKGPVSLFYPSWEFNRIIVHVNGRDGHDYWLDPTVDHCPVGEVPHEDQDVYALVLNQDGTSLLDPIHSNNYTTNLEEQDIKVSIGEGNAADYDVTLRFTGQQALSIRSCLNETTYDEVVDFCRLFVASNYLNAQMTSCSLSHLDSITAPLVLNFKLKVHNAIESRGDLIFIDPDPLKPNAEWSWLSAGRRKYPVELNYHREVRKTIELNFPRDKYVVERTPADTALDMNGLFYSINVRENRGRCLTLNSLFYVRQKKFAAKYFNDMKKFVKSMRCLSAERIVLRKK